MKSVTLAAISFIAGVLVTLLFVVPLKQLLAPYALLSETAAVNASAVNAASINASNKVSSNTATLKSQANSSDNLTNYNDVSSFEPSSYPASSSNPLTEGETQTNAVLALNEFDQSLALFKQYLQQNNIDKALELYQYKTVDPRFAQYIFDHLYQQLDGKSIEQYSIVNAAALQLLTYEYDDFYFGLLLVKSGYLLEQFNDVIDTVILLNDNIADENYRKAVEYYYRQILDDYTKKLLTSNDLSAIDNFIFQLSYLDEDTLISQLNNRIKEVEKNQYLADLYSVKVPVTPFGVNKEHGIVTVVLNNTVTLKLMIDSGASTISLDERVLSGLSYDVVQNDRVYNTANGKITTTLVEIDSLSIGGITLPNIQLSAHKAENPIGNRYFDGLLGRNVLNLFNWHHDSNESVLYLEPK